MELREKHQKVAKGRPAFIRMHLGPETFFKPVYHPRIGGMTFIAKYENPSRAVEEARKYKLQSQMWLASQSIRGGQ